MSDGHVHLASKAMFVVCACAAATPTVEVAHTGPSRRNEQLLACMPWRSGRSRLANNSTNHSTRPLVGMGDPVGGRQMHAQIRRCVGAAPQRDRSPSQHPAPSADVHPASCILHLHPSLGGLSLPSLPSYHLTIFAPSKYLASFASSPPSFCTAQLPPFML
ncbi:hypothetical protein PMIN07_003866 [Paraphaeosphaeria minitans]